MPNKVQRQKRLSLNIESTDVHHCNNWRTLETIFTQSLPGTGMEKCHHSLSSLESPCPRSTRWEIIIAAVAGGQASGITVPKMLHFPHMLLLSSVLQDEQNPFTDAVGRNL